MFNKPLNRLNNYLVAKSHFRRIFSCCKTYELLIIRNYSPILKMCSKLQRKNVTTVKEAQKRPE